MKKLFAVLALVGVMTSCKDKKKDEKKTDETTTTTTPTDATTTDATTTTPTTTVATGDVPKFADADVQAYAQSYADLADAYVKAAESKDMGKFAELGKMSQDLTTKAAAMSQKLSTTPDEAKKLSDFIMAKSTQITEATKKMTGQ